MVKIKYSIKQSVLLILALTLNAVFWPHLYKDVLSFREVYKESLIGLRVHSVTTDPEVKIIQLLMKEFEVEARKRKVIVDVSKVTFSIKEDIPSNHLFDILDNDTYPVGVCNHLYNHITFLKGSVSYYSIRNLRSIVFHELSHCLFGLSHSTEVQPFPVIMEAVAKEHWEFVIIERGEKTWDMALDHLFNQIKKSI